MKKGRVVFKESELLKAIDESTRMFSIEDALGILREIASHHAIFLERSAGHWSFLHLTFQEFFTALYYVQERKEATLASRYFTNPRWREVILMTASLLPDASKLGRSMLKQLQKDATYVKYRDYLALLVRFLCGGTGLKECKEFVEEVGEAAGRIYDRDFLAPKAAKKIEQIKALRTVGGSVFKDTGVGRLYDLPTFYLKGEVDRLWDERMIRQLVGRKRYPFLNFFKETSNLFPRLALFLAAVSVDSSITAVTRKEIVSSALPGLYIEV